MQVELSHFSGISMYLARVTPPMNFSFSDDSLFLKKILGGGLKFSEFAC